MNNFWDNLRQVIRRENTTQEWVAKRAGVNLRTLHGWFTKKIIPNAGQVYAVAKALNCTVEYLLDGDDGDRYVRSILGLPDIVPEKRRLVRMILDLPEDDVVAITAFVEAKHNLGAAELHA